MVFIRLLLKFIESHYIGHNGYSSFDTKQSHNGQAFRFRSFIGNSFKLIAAYDVKCLFHL